MRWRFVVAVVPTTQWRCVGRVATARRSVIEWQSGNLITEPRATRCALGSFEQGGEFATKIVALCPRASSAPAPIPTDGLASLAFDLASLALQLDLLRRSFRAGRPSLVTKLNHLRRDSHHTQAHSCRLFPVHAYRVWAANRHMAAMEL